MGCVCSGSPPGGTEGAAGLVVRVDVLRPAWACLSQHRHPLPPFSSLVSFPTMTKSGTFQQGHKVAPSNAETAAWGLDLGGSGQEHHSTILAV